MRGGKGARSADQSAWPGGRLGISQFRLSFDVRNPGAVAQNAGTGKVYQLGSASLTGARGGSVTTLYDDAGNLTRMDLTRTGSCVPTSSCNQRFAYQWDEVGRLVRARRWNATPGTSITDPLPGTAAADLRYVYNAADQRVLKEAVDESGTNNVYTAYLFDSLELRRTRYGSNFNAGSSGSDYALTTSTVVPFLIANGVRVARLVWETSGRVPEKTPGIGATQTNVAVAQLHVILELSDHLGSTSLSIDRATSEVTSRSGYQAYGASESDYRPTRWNSFREDYKFTGKEEDAEVGLTYFGKRYLNAYLGRWISADPLAIHAPGEADLNVYAYVSGGVLKNVDPLGLESYGGAQGSSSAPIETEPVRGSEGTSSGDGDAATRRVDLMVAPAAAEGTGHAAMLVEGTTGDVYYVSQHPNSDLTIGQKVTQGLNPASGVSGSLVVAPLGIEDDVRMMSRPLTMEEARDDAKSGYLASGDHYSYTGYHYSDTVSVMVSAAGSEAMMSEAHSMQSSYTDGSRKYNIAYNNCADAMQDVASSSGELRMPEEGWGIDAQTPNAYFETLASAQSSPQNSSGSTQAATQAVSKAASDE